ncbi:MAG: hypothetical protein R3C26_19845 [Calditrichia bacterium]
MCHSIWRVPKDRIEFMLNDADVQLLITQQSLIGQVPSSVRYSRLSLMRRIRQLPTTAATIPELKLPKINSFTCFTPPALPVSRKAR